MSMGFTLLGLLLVLSSLHENSCQIDFNCQSVFRDVIFRRTLEQEFMMGTKEFVKCGETCLNAFVVQVFEFSNVGLCNLDALGER